MKTIIPGITFPRKVMQPRIAVIAAEAASDSNWLLVKISHVETEEAASAAAAGSQLRVSTAVPVQRIGLTLGHIPP